MTIRHISRRGAIQFLGAAGLAAMTPLEALLAQTSAQGGMTFLGIGDWGRGGRNHQSDVAHQMARVADRLNPRFILSVGDNFYENGVTSITDPAWQHSFERVYDAPSLQGPWRVTLGNHDYHGNVQAQIDYSAHSKRWHLPSHWYDFSERAPDGTTAQFFVLDTSPMIERYYEDGARAVKVGDQRAKVPVQLAWLDRGLAASTADWKIVIGHHPVYTGKAEGGYRAKASAEHRHGGNPELIDMIDPLIRKHGVALYLNGHDHDLQHVIHGDTHYVCTGAGSLTDTHCYIGDSDFCSLQSGFVTCNLNRHRLSVTYVDYRGRHLHVVDIPPVHSSVV